MKLVGKLADDVSKTNNPEEAKNIIRDAGMELTDEEMEQVTGGLGVPVVSYERVTYECCGKKVSAEFASRLGFICPNCQKRLTAIVNT